ncbi:MAG: hypothetical protein HUK22_02135 [Thermoguttaceae bacterium]|nr:hypothetical protein [Thermoguttaceae bacterium]
MSGVFGPTRKIYKRVVQFGVLEEHALYRRLTRRSRGELREFSRRFAASLGVPDDELLIDATPPEKDAQALIDVYDQAENAYRPLADVSPVVRALSREQFDASVKRVRFFAAEERVSALRQIPRFTARIAAALDEFDAAR